MKKQIIQLVKLLLFFVTFITISSFSESGIYHSDYVPVFMKLQDLRQSVKYYNQGREIVQPGKIYYSYPYLYINEKYKGVHIIDNSDPYNPVNIGYITVPGCLDIAVKDNIMYVDNAIDLVAFDLDKKQVSKRIKDVFPELISPAYDYGMYYSRPKDTIIVEWKKLKKNI